MKKVFFAAACNILLMTACSGDGPFVPNNPKTSETPSTKAMLIVKGDTTDMRERNTTLNLESRSTRASVFQQNANGHFYLRIDNRIPEAAGVYPSNEYYPMNQNKSTYYGHEATNYRRLLLGSDYYLQPETGSTLSRKVTDYIFNPAGINVEEFIDPTVYNNKPYPTLVPTAEALLQANNPPITNIDLTGKKILWYVIKHQTADPNYWHIDGVLTDESTNDVYEIPAIGASIEREYVDYVVQKTAKEVSGNVEVDVHHQVHKDWSEIKTSIHVRAELDEVEVMIPIAKNHLAEADDFAIRVFDAYYTLQNVTYALKVEAQHLDNEIKIIVKEIPAGLVTQLKEQSGDGLTIEVHSYAKNLTNQQVFDAIKLATVKTSEDYPETMKIHKSSAFYPDDTVDE